MIRMALKKVLAVITIALMVMAVYLVWARPRQLRWGATDAEIALAMPGDTLDRFPTFFATRAITIDTTPEAIWPWILQMGYNRAGFYGYDIIEGIGSRGGLKSADTIIPALQRTVVGDAMPFSAAGGTRFYAIEPNRFLIWATNEGAKPNGGFTWALYPIDDRHTRLVSRIRWTHHWREPDKLAMDFFTEFTDGLAVQRVLCGIKLRAEHEPLPSFTLVTLEFFAYVALVLLFLAALILILLRPLSWGRVFFSLLTGLLWIVGWYW